MEGNEYVREDNFGHGYTRDALSGAVPADTPTGGTGSHATPDGLLRFLKAVRPELRPVNGADRPVTSAGLARDHPDGNFRDHADMARRPDMSAYGRARHNFVGQAAFNRDIEDTDRPAGPHDRSHPLAEPSRETPSRQQAQSHVPGNACKGTPLDIMKATMRQL